VWRITLRGVAAHKVRYWLTGLAVLIGVAFMAGTLVLTDTIQATFNGLFVDIYHGTAAVVRGQQFASNVAFNTQRARINADLLPTVRRVPGVAAAAVSIEGYAQLVGSNGKAIGHPATGAPTLGEVWVDVPALSPYRMVPGGRPPTTSSEVVIDKHSADVGHLKVGDSVTVLTKQAPKRYRITGIVTWGSADSPLGASITLFDQRTAEHVLSVPGKVDQIDVAATPGTSQQQVVVNLRRALHQQRGVQVATGQTVTQESQNSVASNLSFFSTFLIVFALIALFVGAFIIFNTFSIVVAQRRRELALLRAVGASRRQVLGSVLGESFVVGLVASVLGLFAGIGVAILLHGLLKVLGLDIPASGLVVSTRTVVVCLVLGTGVTVVSAVAPARRAGRVAPVAALREEAVEQPESSRRRLVSGLVVCAAGVLLLGIGLYTSVPRRIVAVGAGAAVVFVGIAVLGPVLVRPLARVVGAPFARRSTVGALARQNAMRNPRRTSATAAALMVGVALVVLMSILASSIKTSVDDTLNKSLRANFVITAGPVTGSASGLSPSLATAVGRLPQVAVASGVQFDQVKIAGKTAFVVAVDPRTITQVADVGVVHGSLAAVTPAGIAVSQQVATDRHLSIGSPVSVVFPTTGRRTYRVQVIYTQRALAGDYVLTSAALARNSRELLDGQIFVKLAPGVSEVAGRHAIEPVLKPYPTANLYNQSQFVTQQASQIDQVLNLVYGLLILAIAIALIGIANTLALSVYERTRELGLLRAVGMTRRQLRASIRTESVVISLIGAVEGLVVGIAFGWAIVVALKTAGVTTLAIPFVQLAVIVVLAGLAGVLAARRPGKRAAKLDILKAISTE